MGRIEGTVGPNKEPQGQIHSIFPGFNSLAEKMLQNNKSRFDPIAILLNLTIAVDL